MSRLLRFSVATCLWLCWLVAPSTSSQTNASDEEAEAATARRDNALDAVDWALLDKMFASEDLSASSDAALPDSSFEALRLVPEMVVSNVIEMLKFLKHLNEDCFQACPSHSHFSGSFIRSMQYYLRTVGEILEGVQYTKYSTLLLYFHAKRVNHAFTRTSVYVTLKAEFYRMSTSHKIIL